MNYEMDFVKDFNKIAKQWFKSHNIPAYSKNIDYKNNDSGYILEYLRFQRLQILPKPREVYISAELKQSKKFKEHKKAIDLIKNTFEMGRDIMPFTSARKISKKDNNPYNDKLLTHWHIHHLHLNIQKDESGYIERSKDLLFCMIKNDKVYMIDIRNHNKRNWSDIMLLEIVDNNWAELLNEFEFENIQTKLSQADYDKCRNENLNCFINVNKRTLYAFDGCIMSNGTSSLAYIYNSIIIMQLKKLEHFFQTEQSVTKYIKENSKIQLIDCPLFEITSNNNHISLELVFLINKEYKMYLAHDSGKSNSVFIRIIQNETKNSYPTN